MSMKKCLAICVVFLLVASVFGTAFVAIGRGERAEIEDTRDPIVEDSTGEAKSRNFHGESDNKGWSMIGYDSYTSYNYPFPSQVKSEEIELGESFSAPASSGPLTGDVTGDDELEIVVIEDNEKIVIYDNSFEEVNSISVSLPGNDDSLGIGLLSDVTEDGSKEIFAHNSPPADGGSHPYEVWVYDDEGTLLQTFSKDGGDGSMQARAVIDVDNDGNKEVVVGVGANWAATPRGVSLYDFETGEEIWHYAIGPYTSSSRISILDEGDGSYQFVVGGSQVNNGGSGSGLGGNTTTYDSESALISFDENGYEIFTITEDISRKLPQIVDLDNDGNYDVLSFTSATSSYPGTQRISLKTLEDGDILEEYISDDDSDLRFYRGGIGDLNGDGNDEVVVTHRNGTMTILDHELEPLVVKEMGGDPNVRALNDFTGDGNLEIFMALDENLHILDYDGNIIEMKTFESDVGDVIISDMLDNGYNEVILSAGDEVKVLAQDTPEEIYNLEVNIEGEGSVEVDGEEVYDGWADEFNQGEEVKLVADAGEGWAFDRWTGDYEGDESVIDITMNEDKEVIAHFETEIDLDEWFEEMEDYLRELSEPWKVSPDDLAEDHAERLKEYVEQSIYPRVEDIAPEPAGSLLDILDAVEESFEILAEAEYAVDLTHFRGELINLYDGDLEQYYDEIEKDPLDDGIEGEYTHILPLYNRIIDSLNSYNEGGNREALDSIKEEAEVMVKILTFEWGGFNVPDISSAGTMDEEFNDNLLLFRESLNLMVDVTGTEIESQEINDQLREDGYDIEHEDQGIAHSGESYDESFYVEAGEKIKVMLSWPGSTMKLSIYEPDGSLYEEVESDDPPVSITVEDAEEGVYEYSVEAVDVSEDGDPYAVSIGSVEEDEYETDWLPYMGIGIVGLIVLVIAVILVKKRGKSESSREEEYYQRESTSRNQSSRVPQQSKGPPAQETSEQNLCRDCGGEMRYIEEYDSWYCDKCQQYK